METELTSILDNAAPLKPAIDPGPENQKIGSRRKPMMLRSARRRLERRWKATKSESDRKVYRSACSTRK